MSKGLIYVVDSSSLSVGGGNVQNVASHWPRKPKAEGDHTAMAAPACRAWM